MTVYGTETGEKQNGYTKKDIILLLMNINKWMKKVVIFNILLILLLIEIFLKFSLMKMMINLVL
jgi:hypothetical protein